MKWQGMMIVVAVLGFSAGAGAGVISSESDNKAESSGSFQPALSADPENGKVLQPTAIEANWSVGAAFGQDCPSGTCAQYTWNPDGDAILNQDSRTQTAFQNGTTQQTK